MRPKLNQGAFEASDLLVVGSAPVCAPQLKIGDRVQLISGSPTMLVLEVQGGHAVVGWGSGLETTFPAVCLNPVDGKAGA